MTVRADERNAGHGEDEVKYDQVLPMLASLLQKIKVTHMSIHQSSQINLGCDHPLAKHSQVLQEANEVLEVEENRADIDTARLDALFNSLATEINHC